MAIRVVRLGSPRGAGEGLRLGTVRRPPRGVPKADHARLDFYDLWLPELAPSGELVSWAMAEELTGARWRTFERRYRREMAQPEAQRLLALLAALSAEPSFAVGCYCPDPSRCHRSVLAALLRDAGAEVELVAGEGGGGDDDGG